MAIPSGTKRPLRFRLQPFRLLPPALPPDLLILRPDLFLLDGNGGVLLLQFVQQHGIQQLILHRFGLPASADFESLEARRWKRVIRRHNRSRWSRQRR